MRGSPIESLYRSALASAIGSCIAVAVAAGALTPPAVPIADRYLTLAAILAAATILTTVATAHRRLDRPGRLLAVVLLGITGSVWYAGRMEIHEKEFDYLVTQQKTDLDLRTLELCGDIVNFLHERARTAPPHPAPSTWDRDVNALLGYDAETAAIFELTFGPQVRKSHDLFLLEGLRDRDLDEFYRHPASAFQINIVASKLAVLARRLERT